MKMKPFITLLVVVLLSLILAQCGGNATSPVTATEPAAQTNPTTTEGATLDAASFTEQACSQCHAFSRVQSAGRSASEWTTTVDRMIAHGLSITPEERQTIIDYLGQTYP